MVTNHSYQTRPITIKPSSPCGRCVGSTMVWCSWWEGECNGHILDLKILGDCLKKVKKVKKRKKFLFPFTSLHLKFLSQIIQWNHPWSAISKSIDFFSFSFFFFLFFLLFLAPTSFLSFSFFFLFFSSNFHEVTILGLPSRAGTDCYNPEAPSFNCAKAVTVFEVTENSPGFLSVFWSQAPRLSVRPVFHTTPKKERKKKKKEQIEKWTRPQAR